MDACQVNQERQRDQRTHQEYLPQHEAAALLLDQRIAQRQRENTGDDRADGQFEIVLPGCLQLAVVRE